jgi:heme exporter protein CcmD
MTFAQWIATQGHWPYIAGSYVVAGLCVAIEIWLVRRRLQRAKRDAAQPLQPDD